MRHLVTRNLPQQHHDNGTFLLSLKHISPTRSRELVATEAEKNISSANTLTPPRLGDTRKLGADHVNG